MNENEKNMDNENFNDEVKDVFDDTLVLGDDVDWAEDVFQLEDPSVSSAAKKKESQPKKSVDKKPIKPTKKGNKKKKKKPTGGKRFFSPVFVVLLICFVVVFSWVGYVSAYVVPLLWGDLGNGNTMNVSKEDQQATFEKGQFTVLMMGCDARPGEDASRSDTLMIAYVDLNKNFVRLVSIPRDTYVTLSTGWKTKINHAYAQGGIKETMETLKDNFDIDIDYTAEVDFQGFSDVIDALGGITIDVPMDMDYAAEGIDLKAGLQTLDGDQALQFCRFRSDGQGDLGRVERQQLFMSTLKDQLLSMGSMLKIPDICTAIKNNVVTNLTGTQLLQIMVQLAGGFEMVTVEPPGEGAYGDDGVSYYYLSEPAAEKFFKAVNNYQPTAEELVPAKEETASDSSEGTDESSDN